MAGSGFRDLVWMLTLASCTVLGTLHAAPEVHCRQPAPTRQGTGGQSLAAHGGSMLSLLTYVTSLYEHGEMTEMVHLLTAVLEEEGHLYLEYDSRLYQYLAVAHHRLGRLNQAVEVFQEAAQQYPEDGVLLLSMGDAALQDFQVTVAIDAFERAIAMNYTDGAARLLKAKAWVADWRGFHYLADTVAAHAEESLAAGTLSGVSALEYTDISPSLAAIAAKFNPNSNPSSIQLKSTQVLDSIHSSTDRIKLGLVSSDFGIHPVSSLIRGMVQFLNTSRFEVFCFALTEQTSWWGYNISETVEHYVVMYGMSTIDAAKYIQSIGIHILVDLNAHTLNSGLPIFAHRPAPYQFTFLGLPDSTGAAFIDMLVSDRFVSPSELSVQFTEKLMLLPSCYIVNDYAQLQGHVMQLDVHPPKRNLWDFGEGAPPEDIQASDNDVVIATFSNFQKMDPDTFALWGRILRRSPTPKMLHMEFHKHDMAHDNLRDEMRENGVQPNRLISSPTLPWIHHLNGKASTDLVLDTLTKNGHTTGMDPLWAGVPSITMNGNTMGRRAGASMAHSLGTVEVSLTHSVKEYEDLATHYLRAPDRLSAVRAFVRRRRTRGLLFRTLDWTRHFEQLSMAGLEQFKLLQQPDIIANHLDGEQAPQGFHVFGVKQADPENDLDYYILSEEDTLMPVDYKPPRADPNILGQANIPTDDTPILLNVGGMQGRSGWLVINAQQEPSVDIIAQMDDLHMFQDSSVTAVYASHTLEHKSYGLGEGVQKTLKEWMRVLKPGGALFVAVPDLRVLASMFLDTTLALTERFFVMKMIFGAQSDEYDFHYVGLDEDIMTYFLTEAGFCEIRRVKNFNLFSDTSSMKYRDTPISLNLVATACKPGPRITVGLPAGAE